MVWADAKRRMQEANLRESRAFAAVTTESSDEEHAPSTVYPPPAKSK